jgi:hypothetical protein
MLIEKVGSPQSVPFRTCGTRILEKAGAFSGQSSVSSPQSAVGNHLLDWRLETGDYKTIYNKTIYYT